MRILLVDDASLIRMSIKEILDESNYDFEYVEAVNGSEAVKLYKQQQPDIVIMDITMPEMDGITAVSRIKEMDDGAKVIMCSSLGSEEKVIEAVAAGAADFIVKPFESSKVISAIEKVLNL